MNKLFVSFLSNKFTAHVEIDDIAKLFLLGECKEILWKFARRDHANKWPSLQDIWIFGCLRDLRLYPNF